MKNSNRVFIRALHRSLMRESSGQRSKKIIGKGLPLICFFCWAQICFSQKVDSTKKINHFGASVSVTNNGIAFVPAFSLGKPAVVFDMSAGRRLSFDPQFRFALDGKPWAFLFSWRYKLLSNTKFRLVIGAHPSLNFKTVSLTTDRVSTTSTIVRRNLTADFA